MRYEVISGGRGKRDRIRSGITTTRRLYTHTHTQRDEKEEQDFSESSARSASSTVKVTRRESVPFFHSLIHRRYARAQTHTHRHARLETIAYLSSLRERENRLLSRCVERVSHFRVYGVVVRPRAMPHLHFARARYSR